MLNTHNSKISANSFSSEELYTEGFSITNSQLEHIFWSEDETSILSKEVKNKLYSLLNYSVIRYAWDEQIDYFFENDNSTTQKISELWKALINIPILITPNVTAIPIVWFEWYIMVSLIFNYYQLAPDLTEAKNKHIISINNTVWVDLALRNRSTFHRVLRTYLEQRFFETLKKRKTIVQNIQKNIQKTTCKLLLVLKLECPLNKEELNENKSHNK